MAVDHIRYDLLAQEALRGVVRKVLADAAKNGLPGEHHFYVSFDTRAPGVRLSARMLEQYPQEMTVVLQHQFWDLKVDSDGFEVGLSFGGIPERLGVPFAAIKGFVDPSVQFGLQFESEPETGAAEQADQTAAPPPTSLPAKAHGEPSPLAAVPSPAAESEPPAPAKPTASDAEDEPSPDGGGEVVQLDRFRKKGGNERSEDGTKRR